MTWSVGDWISFLSGGFWEDLETPTAPGVPALTAAAAASGQVTLTVDAASAVDVVYARYRIADGAWSAESETFKCTGDDTIVVNGLTNGVRYEFCAYAKIGTITSYWSQPIYAIPTAGDGGLVLLAEAILAELSGGGFTPAFTPERGYIELLDMKDSATLRVIVTPALDALEVSNTAEDELTRTIDVVVVRRVSSVAEADALVKLEQDIYAHFRRLNLENHWPQSIKIAPVYDRRQLFEGGLFLGVISLNYQKIA